MAAAACLLSGSTQRTTCRQPLVSSRCSVCVAHSVLRSVCAQHFACLVEASADMHVVTTHVLHVAAFLLPLPQTPAQSAASTGEFVAPLDWQQRG